MKRKRVREHRYKPIVPPCIYRKPGLMQVWIVDFSTRVAVRPPP